MKFPFNQQSVVSAATGTHHDTKLPGLVLNVTANSRRFGVYKWSPAESRPVRKSIGPWPAWTVEKARIEARKLIHAMDRGEATTAPASIKLSKITDSYELALKAIGAKGYTYASDVIRTACDDWRGKDATTITREMVEDRHNKLAEERGPFAAAKFVKVLKVIYKHADLVCPAVKVKVKAGRPRSRVATTEEMARLRMVLSRQDSYWRDYFMLSILTGARRGNVCSMRFEDVAVTETDGVANGGTWTIPASDAKTGDPIQLPLVPEAFEIIEMRRKTQGSGYVFPSNSSLGCLSSTFERWDGIRKAAGCPDLTQHDLRRTMISRLAEAGVNPAIAAKAAGHRSVVTTLKTYTVVRQDQVLKALNAIKG